MPRIGADVPGYAGSGPGSGSVRWDAPAPVPLSDTTVISPEGELDTARVADFRAALLDAAEGHAVRLVVDLSNVTFIDSSGLGALVEMDNRLRRGTRKLAVVAPQGTAVTVAIDLAGLRNRLPVFDTLGAAVE